jgi:hypothetical protein
MINIAQLPPTDFEMYPYPTDDYFYRQYIPRPTVIDFPQYDDEIEKYRFQSLRRPDIILPQVKRLDTSTESYDMQYTNVIPKSILKTITSTTSPIDNRYLQLDHSQTSSKIDESPRTSIKMNTDQSFLIERRIPMQPILSSTIPSISKFRMNFADINQLNDVQWEVPGEFRTIFQRNSPSIIDSKIPLSSWSHQSNTNQTQQGDITQQQAFEY